MIKLCYSLVTAKNFIFYAPADIYNKSVISPYFLIKNNSLHVVFLNIKLLNKPIVIFFLISPFQILSATSVQCISIKFNNTYLIF